VRRIGGAKKNHKQNNNRQTTNFGPNQPTKQPNNKLYNMTTTTNMMAVREAMLARLLPDSFNPATPHL
jgi:hypothetical protein